MAQLSPTRFRATDANNVPISGAGLFVYETGTTTKQTLYSDADLTITRANPVVSVSTGYWAQFYIATGVTVDIQARQTDDVGSTLLWEALEVDSTGTEDNTSFARDFGANGRLSAVGASGAVRLQFGPPTGDDIGGAAIVSGQNGTDLDTGEWKGPLSVTGALSVGGAFSPSSSTTLPVLTTSGSLVSTNVIALSASYDEYMLVLDNLSSTAGVAVRITLSFDGGGTYKTAAGDYTGVSTLISTTTVTAPAQSAYMGLGEQAAATLILYGGAELRIYSKAAKETTVTGLANFIRTGPIGEQTLLAAATNAKNYGKATHIKIEASTTSWAGGRWALIGIPGL